MWCSSSGVLLYDPDRQGLKDKPGKRPKTRWWLVLECDPDIPRYYQWWIQKSLHIKGLCEPSWGAHVSVIRGEEPREDLQSLWGKYQGERVEFRYQAKPRQSGDTTGDRPGNFWFLDVECSRLQEIRAELGLVVYPKFHLTVGRTWDDGGS